MIIRFIPLAVALGIAPLCAQAQNATLPPNPKAGECYARVFVSERNETYTETVEVEPKKVSIKTIPAKYEWDTKEVLVAAQSESLEIIPATYDTVEETIVIKEAAKKMVEYPAEYKMMTEKVMVQPAYVTWKKGRGLLERIDGETGEILCRVEIPAEYKTITKRVLVREGGVSEEVIPQQTQIVKKRVMMEAPKAVKTMIPAKHRTVRYQKLVSPAREVRTVIPAKFQTVTKTRQVTDGRLEWRSVLCETNAGGTVLIDLQRALQKAGYNPGTIDGVVGHETMAALVKYQNDKNLASGKVTTETLSSLGVRVR